MDMGTTLQNKALTTVVEIDEDNGDIRNRMTRGKILMATARAGFSMGLANMDQTETEGSETQLVGGKGHTQGVLLKPQSIKGDMGIRRIGVVANNAPT